MARKHCSHFLCSIQKFTAREQKFIGIRRKIKHLTKIRWKHFWEIFIEPPIGQTRKLLNLQSKNQFEYIRVTSGRVIIRFSSSRLIAKVDPYLIQEALENGSLDQFGEAKFLENVFVIVSVCDPVHRALSNYLHVTRDVKYKTQFTIQEWNQKKLNRTAW